MKKKPHILIIEDEPIMRISISDALRNEGYQISDADSGGEGLHLVQTGNYDVVITDLKLPEIDGMDILKASRHFSPSTEVIMMTAYATVHTAIEAMKEGAYDYLIKPFLMEELLIILKRIFTYKELEEENLYLREQIKSRFKEIIGKSDKIREEELLGEVLRTALDAVFAEAGSVLLADSEAKNLVYRCVIGPDAEVFQGRALPLSEGLAGEVFRSGKPEIITGNKQDAGHLPNMDILNEYYTREMIIMPLKRFEGDPIGLLQVFNKQAGSFNQNDISILTVIAALSSQAIEHARMFEAAKMAQVARLLGDIGHDVKNMLQPVFSSVGLLKIEINELFGRLPKKEIDKAKASHELCGEVLAMLLNAARRIDDRVREVSDCVKGLSTPPQFTSCHVAGVADSVLATLRFLAEERGISLRTEGLDSLPAIEADERRLYNAFYNLVNNAIPEVPSGGTIVIGGIADETAGTVVLSIADTGRGMPLEVKNSLFTAHTISRKAGGTGLGTKIVKDMVDAHGGQISVESREGVGTTFTIRLPVSQPSLNPKMGRGISVNS